jgi:putative peptidoglycan lipid II flippase
MDFFGLIVPRTIASSSSQINFIVITFIASGIGAGAISVFNLSNNLRYLPVGIIGISFATAVFPFLSKLWTEQKIGEFHFSFRKAFNQVLYISFPIGGLIFVLRNEIVNIILRTGQFGSSAAEITAAALGLYILSTFAQCLVPILLRGFFSLKDTVTPTAVAIFFVIFNVYLSFFFVGVFSYGNFFTSFVKNILNLDGSLTFPVLGLVLAFNLGLLMEFILLFILFYKRVGDFGIKNIFISFLKILFSSVLAGLAAYYSLPLVRNLFGGSLAGLITQFSSACLIAFLVYGLLTIFLKIEDIKSVKTIILKDEN